MSSKSYNKKNYKNIIPQSKESRQAKGFFSKSSLGLKEATVSFRKLSSEHRVEYIYSGFEKIPFHARHPVYQKIFQNEFMESVRNLRKQIKFGNTSTRYSTSF